jgi:uncharacterized protein (UPF0333 family)
MCVNPIEVFDMRMNSKGQGAMEYLMTYGWAILVVIIVGIVLWQSGVFGTGSGGVSGFDKIRVRDYTASVAAKSIQVKYENAAGQTIQKVNVSYTYTSLTNTSANWTGAAGNNWAPGKEYTDLTYTGGSLCGTTGAGYALDVSVTYTSEASISHTEAGTIRGKCEA